MTTTKSMLIAYVLIGFGLITGSLQQAGIMPTDITGAETQVSVDTSGIEDLSQDITSGGVNELSVITILIKIISVLLQVLASVFLVGWVLMGIGIPYWIAGPVQIFVILVYVDDLYAYWKGNKVST